MVVGRGINVKDSKISACEDVESDTRGVGQYHTVINHSARVLLTVSEQPGYASARANKNAAVSASI